MKNSNNSGFVLAETLIVTTLVAGFLVYMLIQLSNLSSGYNNNLKYNTVEDLYALEDILYYLKGDLTFVEYIDSRDFSESYINISDCSLDYISDSAYCSNLLALENINTLIFAPNDLSQVDFSNINNVELKKFISTISSKDYLHYRLIAVFNDNTYATMGW